MKGIQCKHIPEKPILLFLVDNIGKWCTWFGDEYENSVTHAMPKNLPEKLYLSKMRGLIKRGLVKGCDCGCRGDFEITRKGLESLGLSEENIVDLEKKREIVSRCPDLW